MQRRLTWRVAIAGFFAALLPLVSSPQAEAGANYAFLVGVRQYDKAELTSLRYTENDVTALAEVLKKAGYSADNIVLMTQTVGAAETRFLPLAANVQKELDLLLRELAPEDSILVAFSGHGVQFKDEEEQFFCPADAKLADRKTLVSLQGVYKSLESCAAQHKVLLVDACRDQPQSNVGKAVANIELAPAGQSRPTPPPFGISALYSCSTNESSYELPELEHGVFFHFMIEGLKGAADNDLNREIDAQELQAFALKNVQGYVRRVLGRSQTPEAFFQGNGVHPIAKIDIETQLKEQGLEQEKLREESVARLNKGQYAEVVDVSSLSLYAAPQEKAQTLVRRGEAYDGLGQYELALDDFSKALETNPELPEAYVARSRVHLDRRDFNQAIADSGEAIRRDESLAFAYLVRGHSFRGKGENARALDDYSKAIELAPGLLEAYAARGAVLLALRKTEFAKVDFVKALRLEPRTAEDFVSQGDVLVTLGHVELAIQVYTAALKRNPNHVEALIARGRAHLRQGGLEEAQRDLAQANKVNPHLSEVYLAAGQLQLSQKDFAGALKNIQRAIDLSPEYSTPRLLRDRVIEFLQTIASSTAPRCQPVARSFGVCQ